MLAKLKLVTLCAKMQVVDDASLSAARRTGTVLSVSLVAISSSGGALSLFRCKLPKSEYDNQPGTFSPCSLCLRGEFLPTIRLTAETRRTQRTEMFNWDIKEPRRVNPTVPILERLVYRTVN